MKQKPGILFPMLFGLFITTSLFSQQDELLSKIKYNDIDVVKALIDAGADINQQDENTGYTALMWACEFNYDDMAKMLIEKGADVNIRAKDGSTALTRAAGNAPGMVELLLLKGADIKAASNDGIGVMIQAEFGFLYKGFPIETIKILLDKGANVNETVTSPEAIAGFTPLMFAVRDNQEELAKLLIEQGANVNARAKNGKTPTALATEKGYTAVAALLKANGGK
jgi:ankyrin repeat protein